ncbi:MAG: HAMP domain-containing protein [Gammaproteobacteria bacterium]|nr:HAMP domain-containing protein [Gammaproteobacteria bacterium]
MTSPNASLSVIHNIRPHNWSVRRKIGIGFGGLILLMTVGMGITLFKLDSVKRTAASALGERQPAANYFQRLSQSLNQAIALLNGYLLTGETRRKTEFKLIADDIADRLEGARQQDIFQNLGLDGTLHTSQTLLRQYRERAKELFALHDNNLNNRGLLLAGETLNPLAIRFLGDINILLASDDINTNDPQVARTLLILQELRYNWVRMMGALNLYITAQNKDILVNFNNFNERINVLMKKLNGLEANIGFGEIEEMYETHITYLARLPAVLEIFESDAWRADTHLLRTLVQPVTDQLQSIFEGTADELLNAAFDSAEELTHALYQIRISAITSMALALLTGILLAFSFTRSIVPPIQRLMSAAGRVAEGDLNAEVMVTSRDEIGQLGNSFNTMVNHLRLAAMNEQQMLNELQTLNQDLENVSMNAPGISKKVK